MNGLKTPFVSPARLITKGIIILVLLVLTAVFLSVGIKNGEQYLRASGHAVTLNAEIVRIDEEWDSEDGTEYEAIMRYTYQGKQYEQKYKTYSDRSKAAQMMGKTVWVTVDPESPRDTIADIRSDCIFWCIASMVMLSFAITILGSAFRESAVDTYGWYREAVTQDLPKVVYREHMFPAQLVPGIFGAALLVRYYAAAGILAYLLEGLVLCAGALMLRKYLWKMKLVREGRFLMRRDHFISKRYVYDSDGPDSYYVTFSNGENTWEADMGKKVYDSINPGDTIHTVYLEGEKRPIMRNIRH